MPREFLSGQAVFRYRKAANSWPLFQLGPGIFTANIVPPYKGWTSFLPELKLGIGLFLMSYPSSSSLLKLSSVTLRYLNAFTSAHGRTDAYAFVSSGLGLDVTLPKQLEKAGIASPTSLSMELLLPAQSPPNAQLRIKIDQGKKDTFDATIVDLGLAGLGKDVAPDLDTLCNWFSSARATTSDSFDAITTDDMKKHMGTKVEVR